MTIILWIPRMNLPFMKKNSTPQTWTNTIQYFTWGSFLFSWFLIKNVYHIHTTEKKWYNKRSLWAERNQASGMVYLSILNLFRWMCGTNHHSSWKTDDDFFSFVVCCMNILLCKYVEYLYSLDVTIWHVNLQRKSPRENGNGSGFYL